MFVFLWHVVEGFDHVRMEHSSPHVGTSVKMKEDFLFICVCQLDLAINQAGDTARTALGIHICIYLHQC